MATGYATFANGGIEFQPHFIKRIEDASEQGDLQPSLNMHVFHVLMIPMPIMSQQPEELKNSKMVTLKITNQTLDDATAASKPIAVTDPDKTSKTNSDYRQAQRILKSSSAYDMANILRDVIQHGTGRAALKIGRDDLGGKTGTTNDAKDAWFAGLMENWSQLRGLDLISHGRWAAVNMVGSQPLTYLDQLYGQFTQRYAICPGTSGQRGARSLFLAISCKSAKQKEYRTSPPLARPLHRPAPPAPDRSAQNDFSDLPDSASGEEQIMLPTRKQPPAMHSTPQNPSKGIKLKISLMRFSKNRSFLSG